MNRNNLGLVCDDAGCVPIDDLLKYENVWKQDSSRVPHTFLAPRKANDNGRGDRQEASYRLSILFRVMFHCARYGRRVREQVLAFGIYPDIDRNSDTCKANYVTHDTNIPEEGLLLYPVAVRAPTGHKLSLVNDVTLRASLLSHPIAPNTVMLLPGVLPRHRERMLEEHLEGGTDPCMAAWMEIRGFSRFSTRTYLGTNGLGTSLKAWTLV